MNEPLLLAEDLSAGYGPTPVIQNLSCAVAPGEVLALLGRNGMGKTTFLRTIMGLVPDRRGKLVFASRDALTAMPEDLALAGIGYVPAERGIFGSLSVRENLLMCERGAGAGGAVWTLQRVLTLFPRLSERLHHGGNRLSGGEQQMLAIGRALMTNPRLLLIDEATEGLAPLVAREIWQTITQICATGVAVIIVDRDLRRLNQVASRVMILFKGAAVFTGTPAQLSAQPELIGRYIGV